MKLERNEFMLCVDSTNGLALWDKESHMVKNHSLTIKDQLLLNIEDSIRLEKLDEKWSVDRVNFLNKMRGADEEEYKKLWIDIQQFWAKRDRDDG